jgi:hypothetical protein
MTQWGLDTLFNPAKRHMDEEKRRLQATREEAGDSSGGKRIDFESGKVKIRRTTPKAPAAETDKADETDDTDETAAVDADEVVAALDEADGPEAQSE